MAILNYTTKIAASKTVGEIQDILAKVGCRRVLVEYESGYPSSLMFELQECQYRLPCRQAEVLKALRTDATVTARLSTVDHICELMNEALSNVVTLLYEQDAGGLCNVDAVTGKILIPLPWGRNGHQRWGLRPQEADILRQILFDWQFPGPTLLLYNRTRRSWYLNTYDYGDQRLVSRWLREHQVTIAVYRAARAKRLGGGVSGG